jgi:DnaJ-class molecular chaperone
MVKQKCLDCNGTGKDGYHKEEGCITCHGTGEVDTFERTEKVQDSKKKFK